MIDFDNDGDRDIFMACGHFLENVKTIDDRAAFRVANLLMLNAGNGRFIDVSARAGPGMAPVECSKGAAFDDLDNDGDIDVVILNTGTLPSVLRNESQTKHHWLQLELCGRSSNRDGVGARVTVVAGATRQIAEVHSGRSYQGHFGSRLHFGLGNQEHVDRVEVRWLGGRTEVFNSVPVDELSLLRQGDGQK